MNDASTIDQIRITNSDLLKTMQTQICHHSSQHYSFFSSIAYKKGCFFRDQCILVIEINTQDNQVYIKCLKQVKSNNFPFHTKNNQHNGKAHLMIIKNITKEENILKLQIKEQLTKQLVTWNLKFETQDLAKKWAELIVSQQKKKRILDKSLHTQGGHTITDYQQRFKEEQRKLEEERRTIKYLEDQLSYMKREVSKYRRQYQQEANRNNQGRRLVESRYEERIRNQNSSLRSLVPSESVMVYANAKKGQENSQMFEYPQNQSNFTEK